MEIKIIPVQTPPLSNAKLTPVSTEAIPVGLESLFAQFIELEVGDGGASIDTVRTYIAQTQQYFDWCDDNLIPPQLADAEDIKRYRQYLVQSEYANSTISTKLNILRRFYQALLNKGLISSNPVTGIKAPRLAIDPAEKITFLELEELQVLLNHIQAQLDQAKTQKQKLRFLSDRSLLGIMSLEGTRTVEMHQLRGCLKSQNKCDR